MNSPDLFEVCKKLSAKYGVEPVISPDGKVLRLVCPKIPDRKVQDEVGREIPADVKWEWDENMKVATESTLRMMFEQLGNVHIRGESKRPAKHRIEIAFESRELPEEMSDNLLDRSGKVITAIEELLKQDAYIDGFAIAVNGKEIVAFSRTAEKAAVGRPDRQARISSGDVADISILLHECGSVEDFLKQI